MEKLFESILGASIQVGPIFICLVSALLLGLLFSFVYIFINNKRHFSRDFPVTLTVFPFITAGIMLLVFYLTEITNTEKAAVALAGVFCMTKFRSKQKSTEDLVYVFFSTAIGLSCGMGFIGYAVTIELILVILLIIFKYIKYPFLSKKNLRLRMTIPEDLNYQEAFNDVFEKYTTSHDLYKVKTTDLGSLFVLEYDVIMKNEKESKQFIDELRERNGNLDIQLLVRQIEEVN